MQPMEEPDVETTLRDLAPRVLGTLVRRFGGFDACEDAVQEALIIAATTWPAEGVPANPKAWLVTVAGRKRIEQWRSETARRRREEDVAALTPPDPEPVPGVDDTLTLFFLCCHPALTPASQVALTLRAVGGLTTTEIARAFLVPDSTVGQRISRAKKTIKDAGFLLPPPEERAARLGAVLHVLYLVFNEGYTATSGDALHRAELTTEAIRLTRQLREQLPGDGEVAGLLALMLLTDARRPARTGEDGALVPLDEQDRTRWDAAQIAEGDALITATLAAAPLGPYQLQAAIAAVHDTAATAEDTDWPQILTLYDLLTTVAPGPMVTLNRLVAVAMVHGPQAGLAGLDAAGTDPALSGHHRVAAVRAHLLDMAGDRAAAATQYRVAAAGTDSLPERRYLEGRADRLTGAPTPSAP
jgi:predicted RNA polymerase sigma factor